MKKKIIRTGYAIIGALFLTAAAANADGNYTEYTIENYQAIENYQYATVDYKFELPQLTGTTAEIQNINASLYEEYVKTWEGKGFLLDSGKNSGEVFSGDTFIYTTTCTEATNQNGIVSFQFTSEWFAGGVFNGWNYGATYDVTTGEKLELDDLIEGTDDEINRKIADAYCQMYSCSDYSSFVAGVGKDRMENMLCYYLKGGYVYISWGAYGPLGGNGETTVSVKAKDRFSGASSSLEEYIPIQQIMASSTRAPEPGFSYDVSNLIDGNISTPWVEGISGFGEGESVTLYFATSNVKGLIIYPGYCGSRYQYDINAFPTSINVSINNEFGTDYILGSNVDSLGPVYVYFTQPLQADNLKITIKSVGTTFQTKYDDTCISEIKLIKE